MKKQNNSTALSLVSYLQNVSPAGKSALHWAAAVNNVEATLLLLKNGANRDMQDNKVQLLAQSLSMLTAVSLSLRRTSGEAYAGAGSREPEGGRMQALLGGSPWLSGAHCTVLGITWRTPSCLSPSAVCLLWQVLTDLSHVFSLLSVR